MDELTNVMDELVFVKEGLDSLLILLKETEALLDLSDEVIVRAVLNVTYRSLISLQSDMNIQLNKMDELLVMSAPEEQRLVE